MPAIKMTGNEVFRMLTGVPTVESLLKTFIAKKIGVRRSAIDMFQIESFVASSYDFRVFIVLNHITYVTDHPLAEKHLHIYIDADTIASVVNGDTDGIALNMGHSSDSTLKGTIH